METIDDNLPSSPLSLTLRYKKFLNNEEDENNSAVAVEVSEEVTDTQAAVIAAPDSSPTTTVQHSTPSLNRLAITVAQSSLANQHVLQTGICHGASHKKQRMDTSQNESGMGDMLEIMKMDMMSQMDTINESQSENGEKMSAFAGKKNVVAGKKNIANMMKTVNSCG